MRAIVFANGTLETPEPQLSSIEENDFIIAADGGARHCLTHQIIPHVGIGDFDSLTPDELDQLVSQGVEIIRHPQRKNETDLELALSYAVDHNYRDILILGGLGARWDQSLANLLLPANKKYRDASITFSHGSQRIQLIKEQHTIAGKPGSTVSLIPIAGNASGITTSGLEYPLNNETLELGSTRGISNRLIQTSATVSVKQGLLLCIVPNETHPHPDSSYSSERGEK